MIYHGLPCVSRGWQAGRLAAGIRLPVGCGAPWGALVLFYDLSSSSTLSQTESHDGLWVPSQQVDQPGCLSTFLTSDYIFFANLRLVRANHMADQDSKGGEIDSVSR